MTPAQEELSAAPARQLRALKEAPSLRERARELRAASAELSIKNALVMRRAAAARRGLDIILKVTVAGSDRDP